MTGYQYLIVGAGFYGAAMARLLADRQDAKVRVIDYKDHAGGASYSQLDPATGIDVHCYGAHIFHTSDAEVWQFVNRFARFNSYRHRVLYRHGGKTYFLPVNLKTVNEFFELDLRPEEFEDFLARDRGTVGDPELNLENCAIHRIGRSLYDAFIRDYTAKQWQCDPAKLPASIIKRLPVRSDCNVDYFDDLYQGMPLGGYGKLFAEMLDHPNIKLSLNTDFSAVRHTLPPGCQVIYTGRPDALFDYRFGKLAYRSLRFELVTLPQRDYQGNSVVNFGALDTPYTRIIEFKHFYPQDRGVFEQNKTVICREYPRVWSDGAEPFYPVNDNENQTKFLKYKNLAAATPQLHLGGRLGAYLYCNMDVTIRRAMDDFKTYFEK